MVVSRCCIGDIIWVGFIGNWIGWGVCNTPVLTPFALNIHDTYIVNNHGAELKAKAPPWIGLCYVSE